MVLPKYQNLAAIIHNNKFCSTHSTLSKSSMLNISKITLVNTIWLNYSTVYWPTIILRNKTTRLNNNKYWKHYPKCRNKNNRKLNHKVRYSIKMGIQRHHCSTGWKWIA
jgi:hypothetical protein